MLLLSLRKKSEDLLRQCRLWLAENYEGQGKLLQAGLQYQALLQTMPPDEDALYSRMEMFVRHGKAQDALQCYQETKTEWKKQGYALSPTITTFALSIQNRVRNKQSTGEQNVQPSRRDLIQGLLGATGIAFLSGDLYLDTETLERLSRAVHTSSNLDEMTVLHLEKITKERRYAFAQSGNTWQEIFQEMSGHLCIVTRLLERYTKHPQLCTIAGETALLLGDLLFNAGDSGAAEKYYQGAFEASQGNNILKAVILGRKALIPIYDHHPQIAISLIDDAQQIAPSTTSDLIMAWLWAVKAEAYANAGASAACFDALHLAEQLLERGHSGETTLHFQPEIAYATFNSTRLSGYKGACLLQLNRSEAAQDILYAQLSKGAPTLMGQSIALTDLATSFVQQAAIKQAYEHATKALIRIEQTRSMRVFQRALKLRQSLDPWINTTYVKSLDEQLHVLAQSLMKGAK